MLTTTYDLSLTPGGVRRVIHVSQYDVKARSLVFNLYDAHGTVSLPSGVHAAIRGTKPDKNGFDYSATISGTTVTVALTDQMTAVAGKVLCELYLYVGTPPTTTTPASNDYEQLGTANFILQVERVPLDKDTLPSDSEIRQIIEIGDDFDEIIDAAEAIETALATAVRYDEAQTLTDTQKGTARTNIAAANAADVSTLEAGVVRHDMSQSLGDTAKGTARANIGAADAAGVSTLASDVSTLEAGVVRHDTVQSLTEIQMEQARENIQAAKTSVIAPEYRFIIFPIAEGSYCIKDGTLYRAKQDITTTEAWTAAHWQPTDAASTLDSLDGRMTAAEGDIDSLQAADTALDTRITAAEGDIDALEAIGSVRYDTAQGSLTDAQKAQARTNIGAADAADVTALTTSKVSVAQGSANTGKSLVVGDDGNVTPGEAGIPNAVKTALLNIFRKVAFVDGTGQSLYNALAQALGGDSSLRYALAEATRFTSQSEYIDTGITPEVGGVYTVLIEYATDEIGNTGMCAFGSVATSSKYSVIQIAQHNTLSVGVVWGCGQPYPNAQNAARGAIARHALVIDFTGGQDSTHLVYQHKYRNLSKGWSESYSNVVSAITLEDAANFDSYKVGGSTLQTYTVFNGLISDFRIYSRALSDDEITAFLTALPAREADSSIVYELPEISTLDGTGYIDTGVSLVDNGLTTVMIEYEPTVFDTASGQNLTHFALAYTATGAGGSAIQLQYAQDTRKHITWGCGYAWDNTVASAGVNHIMRDILVFDTRSSAAASGKYLLKRYFMNATLDKTNSTSIENNRSDTLFTNTFWIGSRGDLGSTTRNFKGRITSCRILRREPTSDERELFLKYGR